MATETWQVETTAAECYERRLVPALMATWAPRTVDAAGVRPGNRVLDVACGTGIVARTAAERAGDVGQVVGLDLNPAMLAVARRQSPEIEWCQGDSAELPFDDASFDRITCQFALMFFPDRPAALREMYRVLKPGGKLAVATWGDIEVSPPYVRQAEIAYRLAGSEAAAMVRAPFVLSNPDKIVTLLAGAGFTDFNVASMRDKVTYPDADAFLEGEIDATPLGTWLIERNVALYDRIKLEMREALAPFETKDRVIFPTEAHIVSARRG